MFRTDGTSWKYKRLDFVPFIFQLSLYFIENQAFVIASAQGGLHENGRRTWGHTMIIDPWGGVLAMQAEGPGVVMAELDFEQLRSVREQLPSLQHRRL